MIEKAKLSWVCEGLSQWHISTYREAVILKNLTNAFLFEKKDCQVDIAALKGNVKKFKIKNKY